MKNSRILQTATQLLVPVMLLFSLFLLMRGHHAPGGGFSGGLIAAGAYALYTISFGAAEVRSALPLQPRTMIGSGLGLSLLSGLIPAAAGQPFLKGMWTTIEIDPELQIELGTPLLFDAGVYLVVAGVIISVIIVLEDAFTPLFIDRSPD